MIFTILNIRCNYRLLFIFSSFCKASGLGSTLGIGLDILDLVGVDDADLGGGAGALPRLGFFLAILIYYFRWIVPSRNPSLNCRSKLHIIKNSTIAYVISLT